jgi:putative ABC transport system permease protein
MAVYETFRIVVLRLLLRRIMETFWQDLRYSLRTLLKKPGFTLVIVTTLALGIGANATIFTRIKAVLLAPLPAIEQPEGLVELWGATRNNSALSSSYLDYLDYRDQNKVLSGLISHQVLPLNLGRCKKPKRVWGAIVSGNYFDVLGVKERNQEVSPLEIEPDGLPESDLLNLSDGCVPIMVF